MTTPQHTPASILIVDDDEIVLSSLRGVFGLQTNYAIREATDPTKALEQVARTPLDVVISDFLMPQMNGIDFLKEVKRIQPDAVRLLLTGYADKENAIRAINEVGLYQYLEKPWDNQSMLLVVRNALEEKSLRKRLAEKVHELDHLLSTHTQLEKEVDMAARVQRSLLPDGFPLVDGYSFSNLYLPSTALGGDFYDFTVRGKSVTVLVSDVIGHGLQAALTTMLLKGIFQESAVDSDDPVGLLNEMNARLHRVMPEGMYAAASVLFLDPGSPEVRFANAGLPYPFVLRRSEKRLDEIALAGPPLGLFGEGELVPYEARSLKLGRGDVLLVGSDGLGSIIGADDELFEDHRLREVLTELTGVEGSKVLEGLMEKALAFGNDKPIPDDVNLVAITRSQP